LKQRKNTTNSSKNSNYLNYPNQIRNPKSLPPSARRQELPQSSFIPRHLGGLLCFPRYRSAASVASSCPEFIRQGGLPPVQSASLGDVVPLGGFPCSRLRVSSHLRDLCALGGHSRFRRAVVVKRRWPKVESPGSRVESQSRFGSQRFHSCYPCNPWSMFPHHLRLRVRPQLCALCVLGGHSRFRSAVVPSW
jgi:hypothetical protein